MKAVQLAAAATTGAGGGLRLVSAAISVFGLIAAVFLGVVISQSNPVLMVLAGGLIGGAILLAMPRVSVWVVIIGAMVVAGTTELYAPQVALIRWPIAGLAVALGIMAAAKRIGSAEKVVVHDQTSVMIWALAFFVLVALSAAVEFGLSFAAIAGMKNYFQVWGIMLAIAWFGYGASQSGRFVWFLLVLALVQLPFVLHQFFVLVPQRSGLVDAAYGVVAVDVVTGTFGGAEGGGGRSTLLGLLQIIGLILCLAHWRAGLMTARRSIILSSVCLAPLFLSEVKVMLVLLPLALVLLYRKQLLLYPLRSMAAAGAMAALLAGIFTVYSILPGARSQQFATGERYLANIIAYNFGDRGHGNLRLNRTTVYAFWFRENLDKGDIQHALFGYGPGASSPGSTVNRESIANRRYPLQGIGLTGLSSLLWDTGLFGTFAALGFLVSAYRTAGRTAARFVGTAHAPLLQSAQVGIALMAFTLVHSNYFVFDLGFQALFMLLLGYVLMMSRHREGAE